MLSVAVTKWLVIGTFIEAIALVTITKLVDQRDREGSLIV